MAKANIDDIIKKASERSMEMFKEDVRKLRELAWTEGYRACKEGKQQFRNPYRPPSESDTVLDRENLG